MKWLNDYRIRFVLFGFITAIMLGCLEFANGATIAVGPGPDYDFNTIQTGINTAMDGDTVMVWPGEYIITEPISFRGKAITVQSEAGPDETTIRMGTPVDTNRGSVVVFENNETSDSVLEGFTIIGGSGSWVPSYNTWAGGGIFFDASSATVKNCSIVQNNTKQGGGVIVASGSSTIFINCEIVQNIAKNGGGVMVNVGSSITLTDCIIKDNSATGITFGVDGYGGGLFCGMSSLLTLVNCTISGNSAVRGGGGVHCWQNLSTILTNCAIISNTVQYAGGGVLCDSGSAILANCIIAHNTDATWGGGLCSYADSFVTIRNCTICENTATEAGGMGCYSGGSVTVTNSILQGNIAEKGSEIYLERAPTEFQISYSNIVSGQAAALVEGGSTLDWGEGNIDSMPCFVDPDNDDYHLMSQAGRWDSKNKLWIQDNVTSPCIDAGDRMSPIEWESFPNGGFINMGAYGGTPEASKSYFGEHICETIIAGDINGDGQVNRVDLEIMVLHWTDDEPLTLP